MTSVSGHRHDLQVQHELETIPSLACFAKREVARDYPRASTINLASAAGCLTSTVQCFSVIWVLERCSFSRLGRANSMTSTLEVFTRIKAPLLLIDGIYLP